MGGTTCDENWVYDAAKDADPVDVNFVIDCCQYSPPTPTTTTTTTTTITTTNQQPTGNCEIWVFGMRGDVYPAATDCKPGPGDDPKTHTQYEHGKYCVKTSVVGIISQGCDVKTDKINSGENALVSECEDYGLTEANACCQVDSAIGKSYTMCNKGGFGKDEPTESDFTDALCPNQCTGGQGRPGTTSNAVKQVCLSAVLVTVGLVL